MKLQRIWNIAGVLAIGILIGQLTGPWAATTPAMAQIPDAGAQRNETNDQLRAINAKLDNLGALLESGKVTVQVTEARK